ncbi:MAG: CDP-glucose 4,6-dehydratase [Chthoniobacterales bacterium]
MSLPEIFRGRRVLVTGHTGFKGSWLCEWLLAMGAEVTGLSLPPATAPALFQQLGLETRLNHRIGDIRDLQTVEKIVAEAAPEFVFHLAAQAIVRLSYDVPVETYATNVMGSVHVMEALRTRRATNPVVAVMVTTDKCYENREWLHGYREEDPLGGHDPYSSSKGAAEIAIGAYRRSYFSAPDSTVRLASARAGNVIGGGDWATDRIVPDCIRSLRQATAIPVRNKVATRPWQHVLEPLSGYLAIAAALSICTGDEGEWPGLARLGGAFNFGPDLSSNRTVADLVREVLRHWPGEWEDRSDPRAVHEAKLLNLATDKAFHLLGWRPVWDFEETVSQTLTWYREAETFANAADFQALTQRQINRYHTDAQQLGLPWASK